MKPNWTKSLTPLVIIIFSISVKWITSLGDYSGKGESPMYGDFEAQRHWLEITNHLPPHEWYTYDTDYWGLDYPPLTAYHSFILSLFTPNNDFIALNKSRGYESIELKLFMRVTSLITDILIYSSSIIAISNISSLKIDNKFYMLLMLLQPALIIIDHGHFQYNSAMLGLTLWSVLFMRDGYYVAASITFSLALNFKQMSLYYALPIFTFLLGKCINLGIVNGFVLFLKLGFSVLTTFTLCFLPFILHSFDSVFVVLKRVFPLGRGLYEDKVANFWCGTKVFVDWRGIFGNSPDSLVKLSAVVTLLSVLPCCIHLMRNPNYRNLLYGLLNGSLGFFLFSYQVHEKSILLPLLPATVLLTRDAFMSVWFNNIAMFSMFPLLKRDGLTLQYGCLLLLWNSMAYSASQVSMTGFKRFILYASYLSMFSLHLVEFLVPNPSETYYTRLKSYPHLYPVCNTIISLVHFGLFFIYFNYQQIFGNTIIVESTTAKHSSSVANSTKRTSRKKKVQ